MFRTKSASAMSSTRTNSSASNCLPIACTHASCSGEVAVPQIAYFRTGRVYPGQRNRSRSRGIRRSLPRPSPRSLDATHDRGGDAVRLAHDELRCARDLVRDGDLRCVQLVAGRVAAGREIDERRDPATPSATSVVPRRQARPNESETITPTSTPVCSRMAARSRSADASGSSGSKTSVPGPRALDASTPADAQTKPWRVSVMTSGGRDADDFARFPEDYLEPAGVDVAGELACALRRLDRRRA